MYGFGLSWLQGSVNLGLGMGASHKGALRVWCLLLLCTCLGVGIWGAQEGVQPQLCANNLRCVSRDTGVLLRAARFTAGYVRLDGQEPFQVSVCS